MLWGVDTRAALAQLSTLQQSCFLLSLLPALWLLAVQCCSFYRDLQARERWGYLPEMWECGLKFPQAEEASNPSLNGGPSAVARNAADHRLSCIIDSSPVSVAKSIRMPLHPLPAAVPPQGAPQPQPCPRPCVGALAGQCCFSPWAFHVALPVGLCRGLGPVRARQKALTPRGLAPSISESKRWPPWF